MHTCPLLRASMASRKVAVRRTPRTRGATNTSYWMAISDGLAEWVGWRALRDVLNAIPDSNDDFSLF
ncbi:hypothetical protein B0G76_5491 [Paraburkholderia sp. BL23I1N1]|uniref:hypothetical protein n=1 Tax=Paraburkholderia sp. BL23I1N1 TaxID=1938802 RepID=UPI000E756972|nr:hypothetical protein [Paraburkholderia sp. BL23I1N1]RKE39098.1 hypothetical protein B0G76_5491 [Paraburkholderia sp. BL23I1N1]